jgi:hypothetical protein
VREEQQEADGQGGIADTRDDKRLPGRAAVGRVAVLKADQQITAKADALPAHIQQQEVVGQGIGLLSIDTVD